MSLVYINKMLTYGELFKRRILMNIGEKKLGDYELKMP